MNELHRGTPTLLGAHSVHESGTYKDYRRIYTVKERWAPRLPLGVQSSLGRLLLFSARKVEEVALGAWRVGDDRSVKGRAAEEEYLDARMDRVAEENQGSISIKRCIVMSAL